MHTIDVVRDDDEEQYGPRVIFIHPGYDERPLVSGYVRHYLDGKVTVFDPVCVTGFVFLDTELVDNEITRAGLAKWGTGARGVKEL